MNLTQLSDMMESDEWDNKEDHLSVRSITRKVEGFRHEADLMLKKISDWQKRAPGKIRVSSVYQSTSGATISKAPTNPNDWMVFNITDTASTGNGGIVQIQTRIYVIKTDIALVRTIRKQIDKHNDLTNRLAKYAGMLVSVNSQ